MSTLARDLIDLRLDLPNSLELRVIAAQIISRGMRSEVGC